jgi:hypothetical protein
MPYLKPTGCRMPTTEIAGRVYEVVTHYRRRPVPVLTQPTEEEREQGKRPEPVMVWKRTGTRGQRVQVAKTESKLIQVRSQLVSPERQERKKLRREHGLSSRQARMVRKGLRYV